MFAKFVGSVSWKVTSTNGTVDVVDEVLLGALPGVVAAGLFGIGTVVGILSAAGLVLVLAGAFTSWATSHAPSISPDALVDGAVPTAGSSESVSFRWSYHHTFVLSRLIEYSSGGTDHDELVLEGSVDRKLNSDRASDHAIRELS